MKRPEQRAVVWDLLKIIVAGTGFILTILAIEQLVR